MRRASSDAVDPSGDRYANTNDWFLVIGGQPLAVIRLSNSSLKASDASSSSNAIRPAATDDADGGVSDAIERKCTDRYNVSSTDMIQDSMDLLLADVPTIVYGNDPLCGWCFAIGPALNDARERLGDEVRWRVECGGLVVGDRVRPIVHDSEYLRSGFAQVLAASGRVTGDRYWSEIVEPGTWVSNSEPVCRAVLVMQQQAPDLAMKFSHSLTDALYLDGREPDTPETLRLLTEQLGLNGDEFIASWASAEAIDMTARSFKAARQLGVTTYPSLFLEVGSQLHPILSGFASASEIETQVRQAIRGFSADGNA